MKTIKQKPAEMHINSSTNLERLPSCFNFKGEITPIPYPSGDMIAVLGMVSMVQQQKKSFAVVYGLQVKTGLSYPEAATEFGLCVMHQAACESLLDS